MKNKLEELQVAALRDGTVIDHIPTDKLFTIVSLLGLKNTRENLRILHPLPRVNEIAYDVDENPKAYYFQQAQNGLYARQAILCDVLGITLEDVIEDGKKY